MNNTLNSNLIDYIRHFSTAKEITDLAFQLETINYLDGSPMHIGKAKRCLEIVLSILCELRDLGNIELDLQLIKSSLTLEGMLSLVKSKEKGVDTSSLESYLFDYPDINPATLTTPSEAPKEALALHKFYYDCMHEKIATLFHILRPR